MYRWFNEPFSQGTGFRRVGGQPAKQPDCAVKRDDALSEQEYSSHLIVCPVDGCVRVFQRVSGLERHLSLEVCSYEVERKTLLDISKEEYAKRLEEGIGAIPTLPCGDAQSSSVDILPKVKRWALEESRRGGRFSEKQKAYLASKFNIGITSGSGKCKNVFLNNNKHCIHRHVYTMIAAVLL